MTLALRRHLDEAGFQDVRIHMSDDGWLAGSAKRAEEFRKSPEVWKAIDYAASHMYDDQNYFRNPDNYDAVMIKFKEATKDKPFLSTELCVNDARYQADSYRLAFLMGQVYQKNLVLTDAVAVCYCWTLLNVVQPSYGWTRTLFIVDEASGLMPAPFSNQLRVFGAYSRRIKEGMVRIDANCKDKNLLVCAFEGDGGAATFVALNRDTSPATVRVVWPGADFKYMETTDQFNPNTITPVPVTDSDGVLQLLVPPAAIVTLTNVPLGTISNNL